MDLCGHLLLRIRRSMLLNLHNLLLLHGLLLLSLYLLIQGNTLLLLLVYHGQEQLLLDRDFLVTLFWGRLQNDLIVGSHLWINCTFTILLLLGVVRGLRPLLLPAFDQLDGHLFIIFNLLIRYDLRERWLEFEGLFGILINIILHWHELFEVFGRFMHRQQFDLPFLNVVGFGDYLFDIDLFDVGRRLLGWFDH